MINAIMRNNYKDHYNSRDMPIMIYSMMSISTIEISIGRKESENDKVWIRAIGRRRSIGRRVGVKARDVGMVKDQRDRGSVRW